MIRFSGALEPRRGIRLVNRVEAEAQSRRRQARQEGRTEAFEAHAADALVALISGEALASRGRTEAVIVCDLRALRRGHAFAGEPCHLIGGGPVPVSVVRWEKTERDRAAGLLGNGRRSGRQDKDGDAELVAALAAGAGMIRRRGSAARA